MNSCFNVGTPSKILLLMFARSNKINTEINKIFSEVIELN